MKNKKEEKHYFCRLCGTQMILKKKKIGYDTLTGNPEFESFFVCPNDKFPYFFNHSKIRFWSDGVSYDEAEVHDW